MKASDLKPKSLAFNLTPLIDVTFLLIVFFVMSNRLIREEVAIEMDLPREASGETVDEKDATGTLVINVPRIGVYYFGAKRVSLDELRARLAREKARPVGPKAIRIRTNRDVPYGVCEPLLIICAQTGFVDVSFAVVDE